MTSKSALCLAVLFSVAASLPAAIIGTNVPAQPVTLERIAKLPKPEQSAWKKYLKHSEEQLRADQDFLRAEIKKFGVKASVPPPTNRSMRVIAMVHAAEWYGGDEARRIADIVVSFQTPAGGWSKNLSMSDHARAPGEPFAPDNASRFLTNADYDLPHSGGWSYIGTFDNGATTTQLSFLARIANALPPDQGAKYREAFLHGLDYIFAAQFPNGGWPQVWPLQGGYHDGITYNDSAMVRVLELLSYVAGGENEFKFVPKKIQTLAAESLKRGIDCVLATQITVNSNRTIWCQQHDALTLLPTSARNYEMPSLGANESAGILLFLLKRPNPSPEMVAAIKAAAAWFEKTKIMDMDFRTSPQNGRQLLPTPGNGPIWARYYGLESEKPIFGDRDKSIHDDVNEISRERRKGYSWFGDNPKLALNHYARWSKKLKAD